MEGGKSGRWPRIVGLATTLGRPRKDWRQTIGLASVPDPLESAVLEGTNAGNAKRKPTREARVEARSIRDRGRAQGDLSDALPDLLDFVRRYPRVEEFQKIVARAWYETGAQKAAIGAWLGISSRFPASADAFHALVTLVCKCEGAQAASELLHARFPVPPKRLDELLAYAEACDVVGAVRERRAAFDSLARKFGERKESWLIAAAWLEEEVGLPPKVASIIRRLASGSGFGPPFINSLTSGPPGAPTERSFLRKRRDRIPTSVRVLGLLFDRVLGERSRLRFEASSGPAVLLTGSLGAGGAERQLVNTAIGLNAMAPAQRALEDGTTIDSVQVVARSLKDRKDGAFYLHDLQTAGIEVQSYRELPDFSGQLSSSVVRPALSALGLLPWSTAEAVIKLSDWLCARKPQVVHIWQDGLIYAAGLAALLAGVPRIVLSGRSTPPPDRRERYPIEYDIIFKSLMRAPGVTLSVNSRHAASRYASWLDLDIQKISVIPNGVEAFPVEGDAESEAAFSAFADRTRGSTLTLGAVMRLDEVKRPLLWIDAAAGVLTRVPNARFIIIGDGPLRAKMERRAQALGISCQCLFAGRSTRVGYWLSKMDAVMLLSEHEGLPNALIEAQLLGVPVITSPAGGAAETLIPNVTGIVTSASPLPSEIGQIVAALVSTPGRLAQMGFAAREWAQSAFPMGKMLANTLDLYGATSWAGIKEAPLLSRMTPVANLQYAHHASN